MSIFDASASALGFAYQERQALLIAMRRADESPSHMISLELLDDVAIAGPAGSLLFQIKNTATPITDAAPDLWKAIRIWCTAVLGGKVVADETTFVLLSASIASPGSAAEMLRDGSERNVAMALTALRKIAESSSNRELKAAFVAFQSIPHALQTLMFANVFVVDGSPNIHIVRGLIEKELVWVCSPERRAAFVDRLEAWWHRIVIDMLSPGRRREISLGEIGHEIHKLRRSLKDQNLPIDFESASPTQEEESLLRDRTFVHQMRLVGLNNRVIDAIRDFYRASSQRSRWVRDSLLYTEDLDGYADRLEDEWRRQYRGMLDEMDEHTAEEELRRIGRLLFKWMHDDADVRIAPECDAPFVVRGSFHILADQKRIGWHPRFQQRLEAMFAGVST